MTKQSKLKIIDNINLRETLHDLCDNTDQLMLAKWSVDQTLHTLEVLGIDYKSNNLITRAVNTNLLWQDNKASVHDVRCASLSIHKLARYTDNDIEKTAYRALGHAIASGHVKDHAIIASDYGIKALGLFSNHNEDIIASERKLQINNLRELI